MLDIVRIRNEKKEIEKLLLKKGYKIDFKDVIKLDDKRKELLQKVEKLKAERNATSSEIPKLKKEGKDVTPIFEKMRQVGEEIANIDVEVNNVLNQISGILSVIPNIPDQDLKAGGKENNEVVKVINKQRQYDFKIKDHVELATSLNLIDYERGVKLSGNGFWIYRGVGARLEWALLNFFIDEHLNDNYEFILPPHQLNYACGYGAGQFPKFAEEVYWLDCADDMKKNRFMLPTAETALINMYSNEIIDEAKLPFKLFAYTPCYRKEAGSARKEERGMIRGHQFNKIEMVQITTPEQSDKAFEELLNKAISLVEKLGLHFRVSKLAAEDCSASMARTYDIELYIPSMGIYKECSSVSNARDYQARRNNTKYRDAETKKPFYVHTLNGSGLATSRLIPAILEQNQNADGSVNVPEVLVKYLGGITVIK